jgi:hypothetical protein
MKLFQSSSGKYIVDLDAVTRVDFQDFSGANIKNGYCLDIYFNYSHGDKRDWTRASFNTKSEAEKDFEELAHALKAAKYRRSEVGKMQWLFYVMLSAGLCSYSFWLF